VPVPRFVTSGVGAAVRTGGAIGVVVAAPIVRRVSDAAVATLESVLESRLAGDIVERIAASPLAGRALEGALEGPELERAVEAALQSDVAERLVGSAVDSRLADQAVARVLESDDLWLLVEAIARSPAVTAAIARQSAGFADQVAGGLRARSRGADAWVEGRARRLLRRRPAETPGPEAR
jgi:hypothetical protein